MRPIPWNKAFRKKDGTLVNMEDIGGGGGSYTPDYENNVLIVGVVDDWKYYIPMSKEYVGDDIVGYEIETSPQSTQFSAKVDLYFIVYAGGEILYKSLIKTLIHNADKDYEDDNISVTYNGNWKVTSKVSLYNESGVVYESPLTWGYDTTVDYVMLLEDPTA